ncbi:methionine adenosyltransferase [uncultured Dubosiella sp.]|uniref:methionine adenosyltransferase n=1 Tax=uncultured Dubosiella sp. TaxID=1937011 RepID=UPI0025B57767|nr:methionine adenosyltransferase [uncultured Dubosiella sp.]
MARNRFFFTSEAVTAGHPDKICDAISDAILDEALKEDKYSKMAVECTIKDNFLFIYGEENTKACLDYEAIAVEVLKRIGYKEDFDILVKVGKQSNEIFNAVNQNEMIGAGDQGIMFGYACKDTENYMPAPIEYANLLAKKLGDLQKENDLLGLDGKTQVTVEYANGKVDRIDTIIVSTQHRKEISQEQLEDLIVSKVIMETIPKNLLDERTKLLINPSGSFIVGGPYGDSGTTGRKIACDTYGGMGRIGGGCLSSKDPSKVDRSGAYYCRYVAKNIVAHGLADRCEVQVSYAIGKEDPISIYIETFGTAKASEEEIHEYVNENFDFRVSNIIDELDLKKPIYHLTSNYGHFGKSGLNWEKLKRRKKYE